MIITLKRDSREKGKNLNNKRNHVLFKTILQFYIQDLKTLIVLRVIFNLFVSKDISVI